MATNNVNLGIGRATGMFYHAPENTALPTYPSATLGASWKEVGAISEDGITFSPAKDSDTLKNWAKQVERLLPSEDNPSVQAPIIYTTEESMKTIFGSSFVTAAAAGSGHGATVSVDIAPNNLPGKEAYLFLMKDGDDLLMLGTTSGVIRAVDDVEMGPADAITWTATIEADSWTFIKEDTSSVSS